MTLRKFEWGDGLGGLHKLHRKTFRSHFAENCISSRGFQLEMILSRGFEFRRNNFELISLSSRIGLLHCIMVDGLIYADDQLISVRIVQDQSWFWLLGFDRFAFDQNGECCARIHWSIVGR